VEIPKLLKPQGDGSLGNKTTDNHDPSRKTRARIYKDMMKKGSIEETPPVWETFNSQRSTFNGQLPGGQTTSLLLILWKCNDEERSKKQYYYY